MADVAIELRRRGHQVTVLTADRGYDDPSIVYPAREVRDGVRVVRLPFSSSGKGSILRRAMSALVFNVQCALIALTRWRLDAIVATTLPPLGGAPAWVASRLRGVPFAYWLMDLHPDLLVVLGQMREESPLQRVLERIHRAVLARADLVVVLDRFMKARIDAKVDLGERMVMVPPWPHEDAREPVEHEHNPFRNEHDLGGKFVFMYSGNHAIGNPLSTLLEATLEFRDRPDTVFLFVGGGLGKREVEDHIARHGLQNVRSLPYQPFEQLRDSLSAADIHLVSLGNTLVGVSHPCKVYGAMAVSRPIVFLGPSPSHISDLLAVHHIGWQVGHGDVPGAVRVLQEARETPPAERAAMGARARGLITGELGQELLCGRLCDHLETSFSVRARERRRRPHDG